jgi:hypothetical protein
MGNFLIRFPVAAKIAFATAGAIGGTPGSPTPPGGSLLVHANDGVITIGVLLHASVFDCDLSLQRCREAKDNAAFHLSFYHVGIDCNATVDSTHDPMDLYIPILSNGNFSDLRHPTTK